MAVAGGGGAASPAPVAGFFLRQDCCGCGGGEEFVGLGLLARSRVGESGLRLDSGWVDWIVDGLFLRPKFSFGTLGPFQVGFFSLLRNLLFC